MIHENRTSANELSCVCPFYLNDDSNCSRYNAYFYEMVIGIPLLVISVVAIVLCIKKPWRKPGYEQVNG